MGKLQEIEPNGYYGALKADAQLSVNRGWNDKIADALVRQSREKDIARRYPRDSHKRFSDRDSANHWFESDPEMIFYSLALARTAVVAGAIWISQPEEKMITGVEYSFTMRLYESAHGRNERGLAIGFGKAALADYELLGGDGDLGLNLDRDDPSRRMYEELEFEQVARLKSHDSHIQMVRPGLLGRLSSSLGRHK